MRNLKYLIFITFFGCSNYSEVQDISDMKATGTISLDCATAEIYEFEYKEHLYIATRTSITHSGNCPKLHR